MEKFSLSSTPKQGINVTSTTQNYMPRRNNRYFKRTSAPAVIVTYCQEKTHFGVSNSILKQEQNNERFICPCVHFSKPPQTHSPSMKGRKKSNEIVISTNVHDQRMSLFSLIFFCFLILFWFLFFHYHFFFSSVHLSFMEMAKWQKELRIIFSTSLRFI